MGAIEALLLQARLAWDGSDAEKGMDQASDSAEKMESRIGKALKKVATGLAAAFTVDKIIDFGKACVEAGAEVSAETASFGQIMGDYADEASAKMGAIADATGMVDTRLTPYMTSMTAKFKGLGYDIDDATSMASRGLTLAADAGAFWDMSLDDSMSHLNSFINGSYEGGEAIGLFANDTQMAAYAVEKGIVEETKAWANLDEATKQATRLEYAENMMKQSGATGQAAKESGAYANVMANLAEKWRQFQAQIGQPLIEHVVTPAVNLLSKGIDYLSMAVEYAKTHFSEWRPYIEEAGIALGVLGSAVAGFKLGKLVSDGVKWAKGLNLTTIKTKAMAAAQKVLNFVMNLNPIGLVVKAIAALAAAFVVAYKKSETFRNFVNKLWASIKDFLQPAIKAVGDFIQTKLIPAFQAVVRWIGSKVTPIFRAISNFISGTLVPTFKAWGDYIMTEIVPAVQELIAAIVDKLQPVFQIISEYVTGTVVPAFKNIIDTIKNILIAAAPILDAIKIAFTTVWNNIKTVLSTVWNHIKIVVSTGLQVIKGLITAVTAVIKGDWSGAWEAIKGVASTIWEGIKSVISNAIEGAKSVIGNTVEGIKGVCSNAWEGIKGVASASWEGIKNHISLAIDGAKTAVTNGINLIGEKMGVPDLAGKVATAWENIKSSITDKIESAKDTVKNIIDKIKGFFDFEFKWPDIPTPHFGITPKGWKIGDLLEGSIPKLSIDWYAKAMDQAAGLDEPTIFGASNGSLLAGGEAGREVVSGEAHLIGLINQAVAQNNAALLAVLREILETIRGASEELYDTIVDALTDGVRFKLNEREFGRLVRAHA